MRPRSPAGPSSVIDGGDLGGARVCRGAWRYAPLPQREAGSLALQRRSRICAAQRHSRPGPRRPVGALIKSRRDLSECLPRSGKVCRKSPCIPLCQRGNGCSLPQRLKRIANAVGASAAAQRHFSNQPPAMAPKTATAPTGAVTQTQATGQVAATAITAGS